MQADVSGALTEYARGSRLEEDADDRVQDAEVEQVGTEEDDHRADDPDRLHVRRDVVEEARVAAAEERLQDPPAVESGDGQELEGEYRQVQEVDRVADA